MFEIIKCYVVYHLLPCYLNVFTVSKIHPCYMYYYIYVYTHTYIYISLLFTTVKYSVG